MSLINLSNNEFDLEFDILKGYKYECEYVVGMLTFGKFSS